MNTVPVDREEAIRRCLDSMERVVILEHQVATVETLCRAVADSPNDEVRAFAEIIFLAIGAGA